MDTIGPLESIAKSLPGLPLEAVEGMLVTFDTLAGLGGESCRPDAARFLRDAAGECQEPGPKDRLLRAADAVAAGHPCALTPDGLTWQQAAAANTVTLEEWEARGGDAALPEAPAAPVDEDAAEEEGEEEPQLDESVPALPHLRVRHFFPGLVVRVAREFSDATGLVVPADDRLHFRSYQLSGREEYTLAFRERKLRLSFADPTHQAIVENEGNQWLQPVPSIECLRELWELVDARLSEADLDEPENEFVEPILDDVDECQAWLFEEGQRGPAPQCASGTLAAEIFGVASEMAAWIPLLFAGVAAANGAILFP